MHHWLLSRPSILACLAGCWIVTCLGSEKTSEHWAFQPIKHPDIIPGGQGPIDGFIQKKLSFLELEIQEEPDPRTLLRRLYFDMLGLPPSRETLQSFIQATDRREAYRREVERVLASPRHGERWAQHWLDLVRYADTHGYEVNTERPNAWPYRDYVIDAFNDDKPYDRFVFEQLAGDTIGEDTATGFLVAAPALLPGQIGKDAASMRLARQDALDEIIVTTGETLLGISLGCARCHEHKFDPISTSDYYAFQAFFAGVEYGDRPIRNTAGRERDLSALRQINTRIALAQRQLDQMEPLALPMLGKTPPHRRPVNALRNVDRFEAVEAQYVRFSIESTVDDNRHEPCIDELEIFTAGASPVNMALSRHGTTVSTSGNFSDTGKHQLKHVHEGVYGNEHSWISSEKGRGWLQLKLPEIVRMDQVVWSRDRTGGFKDRLATRYRIEVARMPGQWITVADSSDRIPYDTPGEINQSTPAGIKLHSDAQRYQKLQKELAILILKRKVLEEDPLVYGGFFKEPDTTYILHRGDPEQRRAKAKPGISNALGNLKIEGTSSDSERRRALAEWITHRKNPMTARVMVNRIWQFHFGRGLVNTPNDFGINGARPTHPELLDWLAIEFMEHNWSIKHMHRLILLSRTYRQSHRVHASGMAVDTDARFLWRFPTRRLEGEAIRDSILRVSGQLHLRMGGKGFDFFKKRGGLDGYPPIEQFDANGMRRMVYAHKVRMERVPVFGAFDCPDAGQPMPRRNQSTTAVQALNLFNSPFVLDHSSALAQRILGEFPGVLSPRAQAIRAFEHTLGRTPQERELAGAAALVTGEGLTALCRVLFNSSEFLFIP
ncbi:MAG: DUF1549 and DUF1553 domain-containing protein [Verrucomicrobiota bacterium]|nr:DUF1549 and DUF1553 domain-containing protein [Verrucomicrobiota bacterium]